MSETAGPFSTAPSRCSATAKDVRLTARSSDYRTPPWASSTNRISSTSPLAVETTLTPRELLERAQQIELQLGRDRAHEKRNGPRTADIDIIAYDDVTLDEPTSRCRIRACSNARSCSFHWPRSRATG
jgi:2-amino-4-hydroxy-6-hydroxymethyldihydropteridine diphosphokinase